MRKVLTGIVFITVLAGFFPIGGCKKQSIDEKITGKWTFLGIDYLTNVYDRDSTFHQGFDGGSYLQLNADRTFSAVIDLSHTGTWQTGGKQLTLMYSDSTATVFDVQKVNSRDLVLFTKSVNDSGFSQSTWYLRK